MWNIKHKTSGWMPAPAKLDLTLTYLKKNTYQSMPLSNQADLQTYVTVTTVYDFKCNKQVRKILFLSTVPVGGERAWI
jgi:hypothetical protein